jgi:hypothetical protein
MSIYTNLIEYLQQDKLNILTNNFTLNDKQFRGLKATDDIKKETIIIQIDNKYMISNKEINNLPFIECYKENISCISSLYALYLFINKNNTKYKEYFESLPDNLDNFWYYISKEEKELIKDTEVIKTIKTYESDFMEDINILSKYFNELKEQKYREQYIRYKLLVQSRLFSFQIGKKTELGLVPLVDLINHGNKNNCSWKYDSKNNKFCVIVTENIKKNEELLFCYGDNKSNIKGYLIYGFIMNENINDVLIPFGNTLISNDSDSNYLINAFENKYNLAKELKNKLKLLPSVKDMLSINMKENLIKLIKFEIEIINNMLKNI